MGWSFIFLCSLSSSTTPGRHDLGKEAWITFLISIVDQHNASVWWKKGLFRFLILLSFSSTLALQFSSDGMDWLSAVIRSVSIFRDGMVLAMTFTLCVIFLFCVVFVYYVVLYVPLFLCCDLLTSYLDPTFIMSIKYISSHHPTTPFRSINKRPPA